MCVNKMCETDALTCLNRTWICITDFNGLFFLLDSRILVIIKYEWDKIEWNVTGFGLSFIQW